VPHLYLSPKEIENVVQVTPRTVHEHQHAESGYHDDNALLDRISGLIRLRMREIKGILD
jgi:hypothetical protein